MALLFAVSFVISWLQFTLVERPMMQRLSRSRRAASRRQPAARTAIEKMPPGAAGALTPPVADSAAGGSS